MRGTSSWQASQVSKGVGDAGAKITPGGGGGGGGGGRSEAGKNLKRNFIRDKSSLVCIK